MSPWSARGRAALLFLAAIPLCAGMLAQTSPDASSHALFLQRLVNAAIERTHHSVRYDPAYVRIPYPGGDVPPVLFNWKITGHYRYYGPAN